MLQDGLFGFYIGSSYPSFEFVLFGTREGLDMQEHLTSPFL